MDSLLTTGSEGRWLLFFPLFIRNFWALWKQQQQQTPKKTTNQKTLNLPELRGRQPAENLKCYRYYVTRKVFMRWWGMNYGAATKSSGHREDYVSGTKADVYSLPLKDDRGANKIQVSNISDFIVTSDPLLSSSFFAVHFCQPHIYPLSLKPWMGLWALCESNSGCKNMSYTPSSAQDKAKIHLTLLSIFTPANSPLE